MMKVLTATKRSSIEVETYWTVADDFGGLATFFSINDVVAYAIENDYVLKMVAQ
jgi:hypothetical protein